VNFPSNRHEYTGDDERNQRPSGAVSLPITSHLAELLPASHFPSASRETLSRLAALAGSAEPDWGQRLAHRRRFASWALLAARAAWRERSHAI